MLFCIAASPTFSQNQENYRQQLPNTDIGIEMVAIPSGNYIMGSDNKDITDEGPQRSLKIDGFWMASHETTWSLYNLFLQRSLGNTKIEPTGNEVNLQVDAVAGATIPYVDMSMGMGAGEGFPVCNVTQLAASKFCEWLSAVTGNYYRLPTEAEWEYAAKAESKATYFFGDDDTQIGDYAWYSKNSAEKYHKVGLKKPNPWGLYDIYGNVAEWTLDQYFSDAYSNTEKFYYPVEKEYPVVIRGGSYKSDVSSLRSASRQQSKSIWKQRDPQFPKSKWWFTDAPFVGFRVLRPFKTPDKARQNEFWVNDF